MQYTSIGKIGTDIQDNKCSWLVVQALNVATPAQREILEEHYGKHNEASVQVGHFDPLSMQATCGCISSGLWSLRRRGVLSHAPFVLFM